MRPALAVICLTLFAAPAWAKTGPFKPWIDGTAASEPTTQTQRYDRDTYVIRQSVKTNFEAPFLYLLFGRDRALLLDSGAGGTPIRPAVDAAIAQWLAEHHRASIPLIVAHTHGHGDHHMGDDEFQARPDTTVVGLKPEEVAAFFRIADWPLQVVGFDLGGRTLQVIPAPGHQPAHIMIWDPRTRWLLSGDTLYPGRLYVPVNRFGDFRDSLDRVAAFTASHRVSRVMGAHIEMTRQPGKDLPDAVLVHADEHVLELPYADLLELQAAVHAMGDKAARDVHPDFIVTPIPPR
ncbi:MBL fold metallo-hydrolase [Phenylobacterium sp.]|uniref:MBL fold metallo-hydrolase n=1 Tax=Phenylobacterium sp. TaxID=1871053 RepID=UPI0025E02E61|nr:MBL fold metallo-hydrolase [Phenylobacterium sp.]